MCLSEIFGSNMIICIYCTEDDVKCYLYYDGRMFRFFTNEIRILFPTMFNMEYHYNLSFLTNQKKKKSETDKKERDKPLDMYIKSINKVLKDKSFNQFMATC